MRGLGGAVVRAGVIALVGKHLFRSIVSLMELITVGGYRIDFQPGNRYQSKIVGEILWQEFLSLTATAKASNWNKCLLFCFPGKSGFTFGSNRLFRVRVFQFSFRHISLHT
jgi:hypothetical protein